VKLQNMLTLVSRRMRMSLKLWMISLALVMPSFAQASPKGKVSTPTRCAVSVSSPWAFSSSGRLTVEAFSDGPTCAKAVAVIAIRNARGEVLFSESYQSQHVMLLAQATTPSHMRAALRDWSNIGPNRDLHANLPNWLNGAAAPVAREFGFVPDENMTRADYLSIKANRTPVLCYVAGMESLNCLVYRNGQLEPFGGQAFPG
jgi:hypothetical protein